MSTCLLDTTLRAFPRCDLHSSYRALPPPGSGHRRSATPASEALAFLLSGNSILHSAADSVTSAVQKASQALNERGERLGRAEEKTEDLKNSAQQFAETAHKLAMKHKC
uniref:Syntaxin binding protein 6 n=1 Tax=Propithecus coquereli TaxID=379532 RepID=A0A2K6EL35_PROCO